VSWWLMRRRDKTQIIILILKICMRGANKTRIVYQANLNFKTVNPYLEHLEGIGLIQVTEDAKNDKIFYKTTPKGSKLVNCYSDIDEILNSDQHM